MCIDEKALSSDSTTWVLLKIETFYLGFDLLEFRSWALLDFDFDGFLAFSSRTLHLGFFVAVSQHSCLCLCLFVCVFSVVNIAQ